MSDATPAPEPELRTMPTEASERTELETKIVAVLETIFDPEIPVNIYELGLIYSVRTGEGHVSIDMTLTSPMCPVAETLPPEVQRKISSIAGVMSCSVNVTWEPPWSPAMMSEAAKLVLNMPQ